MTNKEYANKCLEELGRIIKEGNLDEFVCCLDQSLDAYYAGRSDNKPECSAPKASATTRKAAFKKYADKCAAELDRIIKEGDMDKVIDYMSRTMNALYTDPFDDEPECSAQEKNHDFIDECCKKFNDRINAGECVTAVDLFDALGFEYDAAFDIIFKKPVDKEKSSEPLHKTYRDIAYGAMLEAARCDLLIRKLEITRELMKAEEAYFDAMSELEQENDSYFGFDLSI